MQETRTDSEFHLIVTGIQRDGRRRYDKESKLALARACLQPGISLAAMALKHGINANLLRKWVANCQLGSNVARPTLPLADSVDAFVPVLLSNGRTGRIGQDMPMSMPIGPAVGAAASGATVSLPPTRLRAQLPNGATFEFECGSRDAALLATVIETLGRCDVSSER